MLDYTQNLLLLTSTKKIKPGIIFQYFARQGYVTIHNNVYLNMGLLYIERWSEKIEEKQQKDKNLLTTKTKYHFVMPINTKTTPTITSSWKYNKYRIIESVSYKVILFVEYSPDAQPVYLILSNSTGACCKHSFINGYFLIVVVAGEMFKRKMFWLPCNQAAWKQYILALRK